MYSKYKNEIINNGFKCLSIKQPFCNYIADGRKIYEIRKWKTNYRGIILLCSSKKEHDLYKDNYEGDDKGFSITFVKLIDVIKFEKKHEEFSKIDFSKDHYAWKLKVIHNIKKEKRIRIKGKMGLFRLDNKESKKLITNCF